MALESGTYINSLNASNPVSTDGLGQADDHMRLIKSTVKSTFPSITGAVTSTHTELNLMDGGTSRVGITVVDGDGVVMNDGGTMKQVNASSLKTYMGIPSGLLNLGISDGAAGTFLKTNGSGSFSFDTPTNNYLSSVSFNTSDGVLTLNRSGLSALTVDLDGRFHQGTSAASSQDNSGNTFIQDITIDGNGHITAMAAVAVDSSAIGGYGALQSSANYSMTASTSSWTAVTLTNGQTLRVICTDEDSGGASIKSARNLGASYTLASANPLGIYTNNTGSNDEVYINNNSGNARGYYEVWG